MASARIALLSNASSYVGPAMACEWARRGHDLVLGDPTDELVAELQGLGVQVEAVTGVRNLARPGAAQRLVDAAMARFGRIDAAAAFSGQIIGGKFLDTTLDDLRTAVEGNLEAPYAFLRAVLPPMVEAGAGQVVVITSAAGARPTPGVPLYSATRAGANMLVKNVAMEIARTGVQVNALGTNFMDFPEFHAAAGTDDPAVRAQVEAMVPMKRMGSCEEFAAFSMAFLDGTSGFTTGQFVAYAGGWA
ncbi:MAG: SDR family oxidoreductase [Microthrixaceae bacterium]|mgnify:CR=1 FL=1|jgi:NAD(P)-dependent dehydrogenase (short-subunit alcohol dehydrogenase family)|nr:SDR family oxidoreductase [Microthrixaceae bacterium]